VSLVFHHDSLNKKIMGEGKDGLQAQTANRPFHNDSKIVSVSLERIPLPVIMSLPFRIALAQSCPLSAHPGPPALGKQPSPSPFPTLDFNLIRVVEMVERAKSQRAEIVIFPEYFLQGIVNDCRQVSQRAR
jgi:hypothetical protein